VRRPLAGPLAARHPLPDALRALALIGVLMVNAAGYAWAPSGPLMGRALPESDASAWLVQGLQAGLLQGKAYPVLAALFGMGLVWSMLGGGAAALERSRGRLRRLLLLGVLHGTFLYFGDILTMYALCGLLALKHVTRPWRQLRTTLRRTWIWALVTITVPLLLMGGAALLDRGGAPASAISAAPQTLLAASDWWAFWRVNASAYAFFNAVGLLLALPTVLALVLTGLAAARLRWLTHRRWQRQRHWLATRAMWPLLALNLVYGAGTVVAGLGEQEDPIWLASAGPLVCMPLALCLTAAAAQAWARGHRRWAEVLAPLGRRTLSLYVFHGVWCALLFSGAGWGWQPNTVALAALTLALWCTAWWVAHHSVRPWPLEAWLARRS
jgi:uncharacterized protein